ncbi:macrophage erythroblast attacher protein [Carpediemonas membranifera]|uniref:Macrophage erythroblast attacher protein n=1 Tax=Carpediemonas membranifera TaxID=201153 RepID=A0A8J6DZ56_9EUKA|nr:macrophage erythroblast attacher protein [Carpediemonas membranifera]|eukprot:KAG9393174.1 macrophage erythroblast attacher protein [Carpediemonas membranifera]
MDSAACLKRMDAAMLVSSTEEISKMLKRGVRMEQKLCSRVKHSVDNLATGKKQPEELTSILKSLDGHIKDVTQFHQQLHGMCHNLVERARFIESNPTVTDERLAALIADHFLRHNMRTVADAIATHHGITALCDFDILLDREQIHRALANGQTARATTWATENASKLKKLGSPFRARLALQDFRNAIVDGRPDIMDWVRAEVTPYVMAPSSHMPELVSELQHLCGAALLDCDTRYHIDVTETGRELAAEFLSLCEQIHSSLQHGLLSSYMALGCTAVRTTHCTPHKGAACPTCDPTMHEIATRLPLSDKMVSKVTCRITGCLMDESNPPMMLPNGHVYSQAAIEQVAEANGGKFVDPRGREEFLPALAVRVYIT